MKTVITEIRADKNDGAVVYLTLQAKVCELVRIQSAEQIGTAEG